MPQPASVVEGSSIDVTLTLSAVTLSSDVTVRVTVATADDTGGANPGRPHNTICRMLVHLVWFLYTSFI